MLSFSDECCLYTSRWILQLPMLLNFEINNVIRGVTAPGILGLVDYGMSLFVYIGCFFNVEFSLHFGQNLHFKDLNQYKIL